MIPLLKVADYLAANCVPWRAVLAPGAKYKQVEGLHPRRKTWELVPDESYDTVREWMRS